MIQGRVIGLQVCLGIVFRLPGQPDLQIEFVIDTGFEGALTLPVAAVAALQLPFRTRFDARLADASRVTVRVHEATIVWDGQNTDVAVFAMGQRPLLGTALLDGFNLNVDFIDNGPATLQRLP
jgi:clan AA aspartic protease